jgi:hypothetical protein
MSSSLIGDIRAVNKWEYIEPKWDGVTLPRPKKELVCTQFELQVRRVVVTEQGIPALSDWTPIEVVERLSTESDSNELQSKAD